jgi:hypothetical protein
MSHLIFKTPFVYRAYLLEQNHRIALKSRTVAVDRAACAAYLDMSGQFDLVDPARYRRRNDGRTVSVANVVLHDKNGTHSSLLRSDNGAEIGIVNISSGYVHFHFSVFNVNTLNAIFYNPSSVIFSRFGVFKHKDKN